MKSGTLNLLEPSGPHQACYGTPLPLLEADTRSAHISQTSAFFPSQCELLYASYQYEQITMNVVIIIVYEFAKPIKNGVLSHIVTLSYLTNV